MIRPGLYIGKSPFRFPSFLFFGVLGYLAGSLLGGALTIMTGLNLWVLFLLMGVAAATFFALVWAVKLIKGKEDIVYYHHEIAILTATIITLWMINLPVLPYLDIVLLGIGTLLAFGRWGCYSVGCCHGKPCECKMGVVYSRAHADAGFPEYYVGIKMFPIPLVESAWVFITVGIGTWLILEGYPPGTSLVAYTVVYGLARFVFEFFRGDPERPYWLGFSEAQWTTLILFELTVGLGFVNILPFYSWHLALGIVLIIFMGVWAIIRNLLFREPSGLLRPRHIAEIWRSLYALSGQNFEGGSAQVVPMVQTSLGLNISSGRHEQPDGQLLHYTLSGTSGRNGQLVLNSAIVKKLARVIGRFEHPHSTYEIHQGNADIYHIIFSEL